MSKTNRWPLKADFRQVSRAEAIAMIYEYGTIRDLESLRKHWNFRTMGFLHPLSFGRHDLHCALQVLVDAVNAALDDEQMTTLGGRLSGKFGPLDKPIALTLLGLGKARDSFVIKPQVWLKAPVH